MQTKPNPTMFTHKNQEDQTTTINFNCETKTEQKKVKFNGNIELYYMVDYFDVEECRWVRSPFNKMEDVFRIITNIQIKDKKVKDLRIQSEKWLSELRDNQWNEETQSYEKDTITNRCNIFGYRYDRIAESITGIKSLTQI